MVTLAPGLALALYPAPPLGALRVRERTAPAWAGPVAHHDPDPFEDADALEELGDEIATLAAHIHAATHRLLVLVAEFDRRRGWELGGHASCAHWLAARTKEDLHTAREKVRAARALEALPRTSAAMARGELSFSSIRALTRAATPENEEDLLELARGCTTAQLERVVRAVRLGSAADEASRERELHDSRTFSVFPDDDGMYLVKGRLMPEVAAVLMRAMEAATDALYRDAPPPGGSDADTVRAAAQRRADAVGLLAERALAVGFGGRRGGGSADVPAGTSAAPVSGTRAERFQVMVHVDAETLRATRREEALQAPRGVEKLPAMHDARGLRASHAGAHPPRSHLDDGTRVPAGTARRLACDAAVVRIEHGPGPGDILSVGRRTRTIPPALRRALDARDRGCRFPGCGLRFTDAHHVVHWADGGETSLRNTVLLCRHHHRLVHEGGWRVEWWGEGRPVFFDPRGGTHFDGRWKPPGGEVGGLLGDHARLGITPDGWTAAARWKREAHIPLDVIVRAAEATAR